jgi:hypothetical protein
MYSRAEQYRRHGIEPQQRAGRAIEANLKEAFEPVDGGSAQGTAPMLRGDQWPVVGRSTLGQRLHITPDKYAARRTGLLERFNRKIVQGLGQRRTITLE